MIYLASKIPLAVLLTSVVLSAIPRAVAAGNDLLLPDFGDSSGTLISPREEQELGEAFFRSLHSRLTISQDPEVQEYIDTLGKRLAANSDAPHQPFHFFVVIDHEINAFAGPGGYIGVNSGLMLTTESENELASVMAHEIAHVTQRHLYRAFEAAGRLSIPTAAATLAAILIGSQIPELGKAALIAAQAANVQYQIDFTRENEEEADRVGMQTLAKGDFDPRSMPIFFERMQQSSRFYSKGPPEFLRTHPVTVSRIADTRNRAEQYPYRQFPDSFAYRLIQAKLRVMTSPRPAEALKFFQAMTGQGTDQQRAAALYGVGMSHLANLDLAQAEEVFKKLIEQSPEQSQFIVALAKAELESKNDAEAVNLLADARRRFPGSEAVALEYIQALLDAGIPAAARELLAEMRTPSHSSAKINKLLAHANGALGKRAEMHRYMAEYHYLTGDTKAALTQAKLGQEAARGDYYLSALLEERLKRFQTEEEERRKEK